MCQRGSLCETYYQRLSLCAISIMPAMVATQTHSCAFLLSLACLSERVSLCNAISDDRYAAWRPANVAVWTSDIAMQHVSSEGRCAMQMSAMVALQNTCRRWSLCKTPSGNCACSSQRWSLHIAHGLRTCCICQHIIITETTQGKTTDEQAINRNHQKSTND